MERWRKDGHLPHMETAHDVRHLGRCEGCDDLGDKRRMIRGEWHGRCYIKRFGLEYFITLDPSETAKVSLGDIGTKAMKALVDRHVATGSA